jgi:hypothetical protein
MDYCHARRGWKIGPKLPCPLDDIENSIKLLLFIATALAGVFYDSKHNTG